VIATGFTKPEAQRESLIEPQPAADFFAERLPEQAAEPVTSTSASMFEEELDVPAYLRQGKLLN
jgi:hypothetical protein